MIFEDSSLTGVAGLSLIAIAIFMLISTGSLVVSRLVKSKKKFTYYQK